MASPVASSIGRVVILGHSGFVGTQLVRAFRERSPEVEVVGVSPPRYDLTDVDVVPALSAMFDARTAVIVCAAIKKQLGDSLEIFDRNLAMLTNVCHALDDRPACRVVYFSSAEVYGDDVDDTALTEETPVRPASYYGIAKYSGERLLHRTLAAQGLAARLLVLRPPLIYGAGDSSRGYGPSGFLWAALNERRVVLWGDGSERRDFVHVDDVAEVVRRLTFSDYAGVVNVASGQSRTFRDVADAVARLMSGHLTVDTRARTRPKVDQGFETARLRRLLPDITLTTLEGGLRRMLDAEPSVSKEPV